MAPECIAAIDLSYAKKTWLSVMSLEGKLLRVWGVNIAPGDLYSTALIISTELGPYSPALVIIETSIVQSNRTTAFKMVKILGMLEYALKQDKHLVHGVYPPSWQSRMLGKGWRGNTKKFSIKEARKFVKRRIKNDDEADAINLARYGHRFFEKIMEEMNEAI
jgi:Holliday junction resolvasome RuvABC endonuclease subunit